MNEEQAQQLSRGVVELLTAWPALNAALQSGGLEIKATDLIATSLQRIAQQNDELLLREYRDIDFALIRRAAGQARLGVDSVIEVKFNYAGQTGEIDRRLPNSIDQANGYRLLVKAKSAYVLYFVAAPQIRIIPPQPDRDSGWRYWNSPLGPAIEAIRAAAIEANARILGSHETPQLYCALLECPPPSII